MILLPVIERELRVAARNRNTYRQRFVAALAVIGVSAWSFLALRKNGYQEAVLGNDMFESVTLTALVVSLLAGIFQTADAISQERRDGTLGLLCLTDLQSEYVVLGKLAAYSIPAFFALATIIPILGIPFLLGGITPNEMARTCLVLLAGLVVSLAAGLFASCLAKDDRATRLFTFLIIAGLAGITPLLDQKRFSVFWIWDRARDKNYAPEPDVFWTSLGIQFAISFLFVALAAFFARLIWRERPASVTLLRWQERWRVWSIGTAAERAAWRAEALDKNPALWLSCRRRARTALVWALIGAGIIFEAWTWARFGRLGSTVVLFVTVSLHTFLKVAFAFAAARSLAEEARNGSLELLLTTPMSPIRMAEGHIAGLLRSYWVATLIVLIVDSVSISVGRVSELSHDVVEVLWVRLGFLIFDLITISIYATWLGFRTGRSGQAAMRTLALVVILPDVYYFFGQDLFGGVNQGIVYAVWMAVDVVLIARALPQFKGLRIQASEQFSASSDRE